VTAAARAGRVRERQELESGVAAVVAGEVSAAGGGEAEAGVGGFVTEEDDPGDAQAAAVGKPGPISRRERFA
jgi:hypothetical protein